MMSLIELIKMLNEILEELRSINFPKCNTRKNVSKQAYEGFVLGEVNYRGQASVGGRTRGPSRFNIKYKKLHSLLEEYIRRQKPAFSFTTIQINKNIQCLPHIDKNNVGPSYIIALGDFVGGELVVEGKVMDIKNKLSQFDGKKGHWTLPFFPDTLDELERYSIVFFTHTFKPPSANQRGIIVNEKGLFKGEECILRYG